MTPKQLAKRIATGARWELVGEYPEGTVFIEIRGIYDGWSVAKLPDGILVNRWESGTRRHAETQAWIDSQTEGKE